MFIRFALREDPLNLEDLLLEEEAKQRYETEVTSRYSTVSRINYRNGNPLAVYLEDLNEDNRWLNEAEFKDKYRMTRSSFWLIVGLIKDHPVFQQGGRGRKQAPVEHQLMTFLCFVGTEGNGMSDRRARGVFRLGKGTVTVYKDRVVKAINACMFEEYVTWPDEEERRDIAERI